MYRSISLSSNECGDNNKHSEGVVIDFYFLLYINLTACRQVFLKSMRLKVVSN